MLIAHYTLDHPLLRQTLRAVPDAELDWEDSFTDGGGGMFLTGWVDCDDHDAVVAALGEDPSVADAVSLAESRGRRLYRVEFSRHVQQLSTRGVIGAVGGVNQLITADATGWHLRTRFPDRAALEHVYEFCTDNGIGFSLNRLYQESELFDPNDAGLTEVQHETLVAAATSGYLDVPRESSLADLGAELGVSESAASERFRRGARQLIEAVLVE